MKAKLIFDLSIKEEVDIFKRVNKSGDMVSALFDILQLRKQCYIEFKSADDDNLPDAFEGIDMMGDSILKIFEKYNINIDMMGDSILKIFEKYNINIDMLIK